jgi:hypothetical protein
MKRLLLVILLVALPGLAQASECAGPVMVCDGASPGAFALIQRSAPAAILVDADADPAVRRVGDSFAGDLTQVSGAQPVRIQRLADASGPVIIIGVLGHSETIDALVASGRVDASDLQGEWEAYRQMIVDHPSPGVDRALVIVGSDRRGAVFGAFDISERMGVSPWHWFADVPVRARADLFITAGSRRDQPAVRYRGIFINDEAPALTSWAEKQFGGANAEMYEHVFDLILRLKGNTLWPAMWQPRAFNDDDPRNMVLADEMGVVMGTSHHEPMMRAHDEWSRNTAGGVTGGRWDYGSNAANLRTFWRGGIERMMSAPGRRPFESLVTIGMRGDGDEAMAEGTAIPLLESVVADQRRIIEDVTDRPAADTPQVWALYKEVQDYYDQGMSVPDDVTLLFSDDNWGQIRRLPAAPDDRPGGYGVYFHFDYVGGPRNYKWLNTNQIEKTWQQMNLAWARGARQLWIVNVGDIKPMEYPLSFFMRQAWEPAAMTPEALEAFPEAWARETFGADHASEIADILTRYSQYAARRKPELIDADSFPLGDGVDDPLDGGEFGAMVEEWDSLEARAQSLKASIPADQQSAYAQLVGHPVAAMANLYRLYYAVAWNRRLAAAGDARANLFADRAEAAFAHDQALTDAYHALSGGRWNGMMSQTHIGYSTWQQPETNIMPAVRRVAATETATTAASLAFEGPSDAPPPRPDVIAIEAPAYSRAVDGAGLAWWPIAHLGRTQGAVLALPQGRAATTIEDGVRLEYDVDLAHGGPLELQLYLVPTLDVSGAGALRLGVSIDDGPVQTLTDRLLPAPNAAVQQSQRDWNAAVEDNARMLVARFDGVAPGRRVIKVWRLDDNVVLQRLVISHGDVPPSYLGPRAFDGAGLR